MSDDSTLASPAAPAPAPQLASDSTLDAGTPSDTRAPDASARLGARLGRFVLLERIGEGGMGAVYAAFDAELERKVAVKVVRHASDELRRRLQREAQAIARIAHPNVIVVYEAGVAGDELYLAEELCDRGSLARWLDEPRPLADILAHFAEAGRGLAAAHAAGVVHRDFKPSNVLFGRDGRVKVCDFGLARAADEHDEPTTAPGTSGTATSSAGSSSSATSISTSSSAARAARSGMSLELTAHGVAVGTPAYMSPEQHGGLRADARADQFAFCVALYEAVAGVRPFAGRSSEELVASIYARQLAAPTRKLPPWLLRALERGLAPLPADRYPSMDALLAALAPPRRRAPWLAAGGVAVATAAAVLAVAPWRAAAADPCAAAGAALDATWSPDAAAALEAGVARHGGAFATAAAELRTRVDARATAWRAARVAACRAHKVEGTQSAELFDRRMACLDRRRDELAGFIAAARDGAVEAAERALGALERLPDERACADAEALAAVALPPPAAAARVADARRRLDASRGALAAARVADAEAALPSLERDAADLAYDPLTAEVAALRARLALRRGDLDAAARTFDESLRAADRARDAAASRGARLGVLEVLTAQARHDAALALAPLLGSELAAAGAAVELAELDATLGKVHAALGDFPAARAAFTRAAEAARRQGRPHAESFALDYLSYVDLLSGDHDASLTHATQAVDLAVATVGEAHPMVAERRIQLAEAMRVNGRVDDAIAELDRSLRALAAAYGDGHRLVAWAAWTAGDAHSQLGHFDQATALYERALAISRAVMGEDHPDTAECLARVGRMRIETGRAAEAIPLLDRAIEIHTAHSGADAFLALRARAQRGRALAATGSPDDALRELDAAIAGFRTATGDGDETQIALGLAAGLALDAGAWDRAIAYATDALAIVERQGSRPDSQADLRFTLARALWAQGRDRPRARTLAEAARAQLAALGPSYAPRLEAIAAWLAARR